jgi:cytochrome c peroxidase
MKKPWPWMVIALCALGLGAGRWLCSAPEPRPEPHRSPMDVVVLPGGRLALTANHTADSASLVDLTEGKVLAEQSCGHKPSAVACTPDGRRAAVSNLWSGTLTFLEVQDAAVKDPRDKPAGSLRHVATVPVGSMPRGLVFAPDGGSLYVALAGANEVVQVDWQTRKVLRHWPAQAEPRRLALSRDGRFLAAISSRSVQVRCWDTRSGKQLWERTLHDAFNLHGLTFTPDDKELITTHIHDRRHTITKRMIEEGWALDNRLGRLTLDQDARDSYYQIALDIRGEAVADPCAVAFNAKGDALAVAAAGTHELLLFKPAAISWSLGEPGDFLDSLLAVDEAKFRRVPLGGRPLAVQFAERPEGGSAAVVANYLLDAVQVVDVKSGKLTRTIALGGPDPKDKSALTLARQGEAIFYDARRSHHQWFSCHSCHPDGHTSSHPFDTLNDDSYGNPKLTPTLRGVAKTGPWTWHGWQKDLGAAVEKSLTETLFGPKPAADDVKAVVAFLETLEHPPNPNRGPGGALSPAAERGQTLFRGKARCARCHQGENYTSTKNYDVKLEDDGSPYELWNPPSLRGLWERGPFLHDGRAETLEQLLRSAHSPEKLGGKELTPDERRDLIEFLKAL